MSSQVTITREGALLSWGWLNAGLPMGRGEGMPCFALLACAAFAFPIKLSLSQPTSFLTLTLPILSPIPWRGASERLGGAELAAGVKPREMSKMAFPGRREWDSDPVIF